jgi:hypothetical protein
MNKNLKIHRRANSLIYSNIFQNRLSHHTPTGCQENRSIQHAHHISSSYYVLTCKNIQQSGILCTQSTMFFFFLYNMSNHSLLLLLIVVNVLQ